MTRGEIIRHNCWQTMIGIDQLVHCLGGLLASLVLACILDADLPVVWADETLSSRCWRWHVAGVRHWPCRLIDVLFWRDTELRGGRTVHHCELAWESERTGRQLPPELRSPG